jgi:methionyl-tRNA formyltransferase
MRLIFMGTPEFSCSALQSLIDAGHEITCVYSQPPRPAGRGQALRKSPVHVLAEAKGIEVRTPTTLKSADEQQKFAALKADAAVVVAYGLLLPKAVLDAPRFGCFNIHASLLPRWRGAAPIQRAIMAGDAETGVTIMRMAEGLDTGPMVLMVRCPITAETTASSLHDELAAMGARAIVEALKLPDCLGVVQPVEGVTYAKKIDKAEAKIDFSKSAVEVRNHIHGLSPFPGAWCFLVDSRVKILKARVIDNVLNGAPAFECGSGAIEFLTLQREGKGVMDAATFLRGFPIAPGTRPS